MPSPVSLFVYCEDVDALCKQAQAAGATVAMPPADMFWGDRMCSLIDPDGHTWNFSTHTGKTFEFKPGSVPAGLIQLVVPRRRPRRDALLRGAAACDPAYRPTAGRWRRTRSAAAPPR